MEKKPLSWCVRVACNSNGRIGILVALCCVESVDKRETFEDSETNGR